MPLSPVHSLKYMIIGPLDEPYLPHVPSPPAPIPRLGHRDIEDWTNASTHAPPYPITPEVHSASRSTEPRRSKRGEKQNHRKRSNSYRPPFFREASTGGTERALTRSPGHSRERQVSEDHSETTEEIERAERKVSFREPEVRNVWLPPFMDGRDD
jgi:hypothetical protein